MNLQARSALSMLPLSLALSIALTAPLAAKSADQPMDMHRHGTMHESSPSPLVNKVRSVTSRFRNINVALDDGWVQATPCVSSPNQGAMGIHFIKPDRVHDGVLKSDEPEMLIYEPLPAGKFRLLGVEYLVIASEFAAKNPPGTAPSIDGHLANFVGEPNRYALPAFYEMHVWAWQDNRNGAFADFNSRVSCARQAG